MNSKLNTILASLRTVPRGFWIGLASVVVLFAGSLVQLVTFSLSGSLYSHIILIPVVSIYLVVTRRSASVARGDGRSEMEESGSSAIRREREVEGPKSKGQGDTESTFDTRLSGLRRATAPGVALIALGMAGIFAYWFFGSELLGEEVAIEALLAWQIGAFLLCFLGVCLITLPYSTVRSLAFPLGFLAFMVPFPPGILHGIETILQHGSADAAYGMFRLAGMPVFREELLLQLPGINLEVAPECSGIRSSLVLFITSTLAGYMFLRTNWKRWVLAIFIIPLAMLRNGFRIFVIGELCVQIGPEMIHSYLHRQGGPIFFALSLLPLFVLLWVLWRSEGRGEMREGTEVVDAT